MFLLEIRLLFRVFSALRVCVTIRISKCRYVLFAIRFYKMTCHNFPLIGGGGGV